MKWNLVLLAAVLVPLNAANAATSTLSRAACLAKLKTLASDHSSHLLVPAGAAFAAEVSRFAALAPVNSANTSGTDAYAVSYPTSETNATSLTTEWKVSAGDNDRTLMNSISQERFATMSYEFDISESWSRGSAGDQEEESISQQFDVLPNCELQLFQTSISHRQLKDGTLSQSDQVFAGALPKNNALPTQKAVKVPTDGAFFFSMSDLFTAPEFKAQLTPGAPKVYISSGIAIFPLQKVQRTAMQVTAPFAKAPIALNGYQISYAYEGAVITSIMAASADESIELSRNFGDQWWVPASVFSSASIVRLDHSADLQVILKDGQNADGAIKKVDLKTNVPFAFSNLGVYWQVLSYKTNSPKTNSHGHMRLLPNRPTTYETVMVARDPLTYTDIKGDAPLKPGTKRPFLFTSRKVLPSAPEVVKVADEALAKSSNQNDRMAISESIAQVLQNHISYEYTEVNSGGKIIYQTAQETLQLGKGICEDFSLVFASVARHLGIPTRVMSGLSLSTSHVGYHAWVEVEIRDGVWIPIDPQNPLDQFDPGGYAPFSAEADDDELATASQNSLPDKPVTTILETR